MRYDPNETAMLRQMAFVRANGFCECGECEQRLKFVWELDHFWGRVRQPQKLENVWCLNPECHFKKTRNSPGAIAWCERFAEHATRHGYEGEVVSANNRIFSLKAKGFR